MLDCSSLSHVRWDCKYHIVFVPKYSIAFVIGFLKGKSAVLIHRTLLGKPKVSGLHFWTRGYCVSTVGLDEATIMNDSGKIPDTTINSIGMEFILIPPGSFKMGGDKRLEQAEDHETPRHIVKISKAFFMGKYVVTQTQ